VTALRTPFATLLLAGLLLAPATLRADPALTPSGAMRQSPTPIQLPTATRVVVHKAARRMDLMRGNEVLGSYHIALGLVPTGHKEKVGDFRTPEGRYQLAQRAQRFLPLHPGLLSRPGRREARQGQWLGSGWLDHDPRPAQPPEAGA
jgi:murein L,D-transpeptidase YafK